MMELESGIALHNSSVVPFSFPTFPNVVVSRFDKKNEIPKVGDI
jgi:hypothetical protein